MATASKEDLALLPGFGPLKVIDLAGFLNIKSSIREDKIILFWRTVGPSFISLKR